MVQRLRALGMAVGSAFVAVGFGGVLAFAWLKAAYPHYTHSVAMMEWPWLSMGAPFALVVGAMLLILFWERRDRR